MKTSLRILLSATFTITCAALCAAQTPQASPSPSPTTQAAQLGPHRIADGSRVFVAPMEGGLNTFITAELVKERLPITIVTDEANADYIITGAALRGEDRWYHTVFGSGRDRTEGSIQIVSVQSRSVIWAGEAGDRSLFWGNLRRGGRRRVANRLVDQMERDLFARGARRR
jgi:hypothetical protein